MGSEQLEWLRALAPTVATILGGPLAGLVVGGLGKILGIDNATKDTIVDALRKVTLTESQLIELKRLEEQAQENVRRYNIDLNTLEVRDRESARWREAMTRDNTNRSIAYIIIFSFIGTSGAILFNLAKVDSVIAGTIIGYLSAKAEQVLSYYFGSTSGSKLKSELLAKQSSDAAERK